MADDTSKRSRQVQKQIRIAQIKSGLGYVANEIKTKRGLTDKEYDALNITLDLIDEYEETEVL